ncbi:MAG: FG-GAP-like repeat-containing protein [Ignavibacteria bacterium]
MKKIIILFLIITSQNSTSQITPTLMQGFPVILDSVDYTYNNGPIIADFNNDGQNEVLVGVNGLLTTGKVILLNNNGEMMQGFPKFVSCFSSYIWTAAGDIDNDGFLDIVVKSDSLYVFDRNGNNINGFPIYTFISTNSLGDRISLYDLDNDGSIEIILSRKNVMTVVNNNGIIRTGWPVTITNGANPFLSYFSIGDIDDDNSAEIIIPSSNNSLGNIDSNKIFLLNPDGTQHNISPIYSDSGYYFDTWNYPIIFDYLNKSQIAILSNYSKVRLPGDYKSRLTIYNSDGSIFSRGNFNSRYNTESMTMYIPESQQPVFLCAETFYSYALNMNGSVLPNYPIFLESDQLRNLNIGKINGQWSFIGSKSPDTSGGNGLRGIVKFFNVESGQSLQEEMRPIGGPGTAANLTDLNNDGQLDVVITTNSVTKNGDGCALYAWTIQGVPYTTENFPWSMWGHDRYRTNQYGFIPPDDPIGIQPINSNVPTSFKLYQNYPNPFNPITTIKFDVVSNNQNQVSNILLKIYDVLGRELVVLLNEQLRQGTYSVKFDGNNYNSGVYFYTLRSDDISETKKLLLLK